MPNDNPNELGSEVGADPDSQSENISDGRAAYNVVTDTVVGLNARKSDNLFQAIFILVMILLFAAIGTVLAVFNRDWELPWFGGALAGAFAGMVIGLFTSGVFLMIYRALQHMKGKHE